MNRPSIDQIKQSLEAGCAWLISQIDEQGRVAESDHISVYSKVPASLLLSGRIEPAYRVLNWIADQALEDQAPDGQQRLMLSPQVEADYPFSTYERAWVARGALVGERYDLVPGLIDQIEAHQDVNTGGFWDTAAEKEEAAGQQSGMTAGMAGLALVAGGRMEAAIRAAEFLAEMYEDQPEREAGFYAVRDIDGNGQAQPFLQVTPMSYVDLHGTGQRPGRFGPVLGFLVWLYRGTGQARFLKLAKSYANLYLDSSDEVFLCVECHKFLWGLTELHQVAPDGRYLGAIDKGLAYLLAAQQPDGYWLPTTPGPDPVPSTMKVAVLTNVLVGLASIVAIRG